MALIKQAGSPQKISSIIPLGKETVNLRWKDKKGDNMDINEYSYLWTTKKEEFVLVNTEYGYGIVNKKDQTVLSISDEDVEEAVIKKMIDEGNRMYKNILDAYADI